MALTASYIAACMIAKLRVGWMVAGCAPGVRTITKSVRLHCTTWLTGFVVSAITGARLAAASAAIVVPASNRGFILDLTPVDMRPKPGSGLLAGGQVTLRVRCHNGASSLALAKHSGLPSRPSQMPIKEMEQKSCREAKGNEPDLPDCTRSRQLPLWQSSPVILGRNNHP